MRCHTTRRRFLCGASAAGVIAIAGCAGDGGVDGGAAAESPDPTERPATSEQPGGGAAVGESSAGPPPTADLDRHLPHSLADLRDSTSRGAGKDQIPSIDEPEFAPPAELTYPEEMLVFGIVRDGVARAYPQRLLVYHEIVNDRIGGEPVAITYCPLTGTVLGFERGEATFGVSGLLINNNLVMYDRSTETQWPQIPAVGLDGPLAGESLREVPLVWTSLGAWTEAHPDTTVLTKTTGYTRRYGQDPYGGGYETHPLDATGFYGGGSTMFAELGEPDDRLEKKAIVVGVRDDRGAVAFDRSALREAGQLTGEIEETPYLAVHDRDLDAVYVYRNPESHTFERVEDGSRAEQNDLRAADGAVHEPAALPLERTMAFEAKWFAWHGYYPETGLVS